jgi:hypothetical protein
MPLEQAQATRAPTQGSLIDLLQFTHLQFSLSP